MAFSISERIPMRPGSTKDTKHHKDHEGSSIIVNTLCPLCILRALCAPNPSALSKLLKVKWDKFEFSFSMSRQYLPLLLILVTVACKNTETENTLFTLQQNTGINFNNRVVDDSLENSFYFRNYYNGGGVAIGDIDNDGLCEVLLTSNMEENKLYLNKGNMQFEDITSTSGMKQDSMWSTGVSNGGCKQRRMAGHLCLQFGTHGEW